MLILVDKEGNVSFIDGETPVYQATSEEFAADAPDVLPAIPPGYRLAIMDTSTGVCTGYDAKDNAFPGIEWDAGKALPQRVGALKGAHAARIAAGKRGKPEYIVPQEVVKDVEDINQMAEVTIL